METTKINIEQLVHDYGDYLFRYAFSKVERKEIAEDLVQETYIVAVTKSQTFRGDSSPKTWLTSILRNKIFDYYRQKAKENIAEAKEDALSDSFDEKGNWKKDHLPFVFEETPEDLLNNADFLVVFNLCIDNLPPVWASVIKMRFIDAQKGKKVCQELNISESNLWQIIHRSKLKLKDCLTLNWNKQ